ncbi:hypothetical protein [Priestia megaterium]|nr:hypothetical protein [Priestia megaterium]
MKYGGDFYIGSDNMPPRLTLTDIEQRLKQRGIILVSKDVIYKNKYTTLTVRCENHPQVDVKTDWSHISNGNPCNECSRGGRAEKLKALAHTEERIEEAQKEFENRGFRMVGNYLNVNTPIEFYCPKHPSYPNIITLSNLRISKHGCRACRNEAIAQSKRTDFEIVESYFVAKGYLLNIQPHEYKNGKEKLAFICPKHPTYPNAMTFEAIKFGNQGCVVCWEERRGDALRKDFTEVQSLFLERDYELLATENDYSNNKKRLPFRCPIHPQYLNSISVNSLTNGQGCKPCGDARVRDAHRIPYSFVKGFFKQKGYKLLTNSYQNNSQILWYCCPYGHKRPTTFRNFYYNHARCKKCDNESRRGENNHGWKGGVTEINHYLRASIIEWKKKWLKEFDYQCFLTSKNHSDLHVHHLNAPYHKIRDEALEELSLVALPRICDYDSDKLHQLRDLVMEKHEKIKGIPLRKEIHDLFHDLYGYDVGDNEFYEFAVRYKSGEFYVPQ